MPNHVHVVVRPVEGHSLKEILHSWKSFTSHKLNELLGRQGKLWQDESFDCIVRTGAQLDKIAFYIQENPAKAGLKQGEFRIGFGSNVGQASRLSTSAPALARKKKGNPYRRLRRRGQARRLPYVISSSASAPKPPRSSRSARRSITSGR